MDRERSTEKMTVDDLRILGEIARQDRVDFFSRYPNRKNEFMCSALCQGAALHYIDGKSGVKDFDVWSFYKADESSPFPWRRRMTKDFGESKFGVHPDDKKAGYKGRSVDLFGRSIEFRDGEPLVQALQRYLSEGKTPTARELSQKAVVLIEPEELLGCIVWPKE